ncbi:MAG: N-acetyltransferase [Bacteroidales bacterium]|nr:N-acetyltransferase [Bacteroidales bacterium]
MADYTLVEVKDKKCLKEFIRFPDRLYKDCAQYVPALHSDQMKTLTRDAALDYCTHRMWMVRDGRQVVGRICAMVNPRYNERYGKKCVRFGWFDCIDDGTVAGMLLSAAENWGREQGMDTIHGPLFFNTLGKQGMLVEGFGNIPPFNCLYNYPYYNRLVQDYGFEKECDWVQYRMDAAKGVPEKAERVARIIEQRYNLHFGSIDRLKKDPAMVRKFFHMYSDSFAGSVYNFIPFTEKEIDQEAASILPFVSDKACVLVLDENEEIVAFGICTPSISKALQKARGRLFPFGWYHLLRAMNDFSVTDLMINGAVPEWQNRGVSAMYYKEMAAKARKIGMDDAISNPQIETNSAANIWNAYEDHTLFMRRRCYIKKIGETSYGK